LQQTTFLQGDFAEIESHISSTDFVYFDPPYYPVSGTASFTGYAMRNPMSQRTRGNVFGVDDQQRLSVTFAKLAARGSFVMLSNSDTRRIRVLYRDFQIEKVKARRAINCNGAKRGVVDEVLVLSKR
jgi:DNA adenine methylase